MVIFDRWSILDTAWINGEFPPIITAMPAPPIYRALERAHLIELPTDPADAEQGIEPALAPVTGWEPRRSDHEDRTTKDRATEIKHNFAE